LNECSLYVSCDCFYDKQELKYFRPSPILAGLCVLKTLEPELFQKAKAGSLTFEEASTAFKFSQWPTGHTHEWAQKWWRYSLSDDLDMQNEEWRDWGRGTLEFSMMIERILYEWSQTA